MTDRFRPARGMVLAAGLAILSGCAVHHHHPRGYAIGQDDRRAHVHARFVVVHHRPAADRTCWKHPRGWRCVVR